MNKAVLKFTPLEYAYEKKFGIMPDMHFERLLEQTGDSEKAGYIVNRNMYSVWTEQRILHWIIEKNNGFSPVRNSPFDN